MVSAAFCARSGMADKMANKTARFIQPPWKVQARRCWIVYPKPLDTGGVSLAQPVGCCHSGAGNFLDQHHPSRGFYLCFALLGSRFAASTFPSSAEEGSFLQILFLLASRSLYFHLKAGAGRDQRCDLHR